jgi:hypothetical protein
LQSQPRHVIGLGEQIKDIESVLTVLGGKPVYAAEPFADLAPPPLPAVIPEWAPSAHIGGYQRSQR